jgi:hypothetical protein
MSQHKATQRDHDYISLTDAGTPHYGGAFYKGNLAHLFKHHRNGWSLHLLSNNGEGEKHMQGLSRRRCKAALENWVNG